MGGITSAAVTGRISGIWRRSPPRGNPTQGKPTARAAGSSLLWPTVFIALACLMMLGLQGLIEWEARAAQVRKTEVSLVNLASSLTQHAEDTIEVADTALAGLVERLETEGTSPEVLANLDRELEAQAAVGTRYRNVVILGADGNWLASSMSRKGGNYSDREYFQHHRDNPGRGPFVGPAIQSYSGAIWIITVSRRFRSVGGGFGGVVFADIGLSYFADHYATYDLGPDSFISLLATDGSLLARHPSREELIGKRTFSTAELFRELPDHPVGSYLMTAIIDGVRRFAGYRASNRYPLVVVATMSEDQALAAWRADAREHLAITLVLSGGLGLLGLYLIRLMRRFQAAEEQARESEIRYRLLADHANDIVTRVGPDGLRQYVSQAALRIIGVSPAALLGSKLLDFVHPDDRQGVVDRVARLTAGKTDTQRPRYRICRPDGVVVWIEASTQVLTDQMTGAPDGYVSTLRDVTVQVEALAALRASEERYRVLTDSSTDMIFILDRQHVRRYVSPASHAMLGYAPEELIGSAIDRIHPDDAERVVRIHDQVFAGGGGTTTTKRVRHRDGHWVSVEATFNLVRDPVSGAPLEICGSLRDITERVASETALRDSEARYRLLADNSTDMIAVVDRQFICRYVSPSSRELLGYAPEDLVGLSGTLIVHPDDVALVMTSFEQLVVGRQHDHDRIIYRLRHRDGHWVSVESVRKVLYSPDTGEPTGLCSVLRDISERVAAEAALRTSEERFRLLLESSVIEAIYMLDPDGNIESWNAAAERIKGYTPGEIIGKNFAVFFTPEDLAIGEPARVLGIARHTGRFAADGWRVRKDGSRFLARVAISAIRKDDGTLRGFAKVTYDVTDQQIADEQRAIIIEAAPNGMMIVDEAGIITLANSQVELIFDYPVGTLVGQSVDILVPEAFRVAHGALRSAFTSGRSDQAMAPERQFTGRKRDGSPVTIEIMLSPVRTPRGRIVVASLFDITERTRRAAELNEAEALERAVIASTNASVVLLAKSLEVARDEAEEASRAKSRFLTGITHELRTPLHGIIGYSELLRLEGGLNSIQTERVAAMMAAGEHLLGMINAVLDVSQIEADRLELHPDEIELADFACVCLDLVRPAAEAKGLALSLVAAGPIRLVADPTRLRQVVINLLGNAIKFTPAGSVELRLQEVQGSDFIRLEVADTGPGIRSHHFDKLFEPFERLNAKSVGTIEGSGVGLALAKRLTRLMGGQIGYADNPGGGSVFWLELPPGDAGQVAAKAAATAANAETGSLRVLVVDDEALNRNIASGFLRFGGHEVVCLDNGAAAVEAAATGDFDVILMDVRMAGMDGLEATRRIRALPAPHGTVPVVAVTAQAFAEQIEICQQAGMGTHVSKPFTKAALLAAVAKAVNAPRASSGAWAPPGAASRAAEPDYPEFDRTMFEDLSGSLSAAEVEEHMQTLVTRCEALLRGLRSPDLATHAGELVDDAHRLAGGAGTFGFLHLADAARRFERAVESGSIETVALAGHLAATIEMVVAIMRHELADMAAVAT
jgi:PAS domain S-box-containing protein